MSIEHKKIQLLISYNEGLRLQPYRCSEGYLTIGYGLNLDAGISQEEAELLRDHRIAQCVEDLSAFQYWDALSEVRKAVLIDLRYQLGLAGYRGFVRMNAALARGDYADAAKEMLDSVYAHQVPSRAARNAVMMRENTWSPVVLVE